MKTVFGWLVVIFIGLAIVGGLTKHKDQPKDTYVAPTYNTPTTTYDTPPTTTLGTAWAINMGRDTHGMADLMKRISTDADALDTASLQADCVEGQTDLGVWKIDAAEVPIAAIGTPYAAGLDHFQSAFDSCVAGDYNTTTAEMRLGSADITTATAAITG